ncbi:MAG: LuxR C-terminal-related transcriptional regulator [Terriglobia bacterium]
MNNDRRATSIAVAANEPIVRYGVRRLFEAEPDLHVVAEAANSSEAITVTLTLKPEVLVLDLAAPISGLDVLTRLASVKSCVRTLLLASPVDLSQFDEAFNMGARGVVLKGSPTGLLLNAVRSVIAGQYWAGEQAAAGIAAALRTLKEQDKGCGSAHHYGLTPRELEVIATITTGCSNKDVGRKFSIAERTVKHHLTNIYDKLGLSNRLELALFAVTNHLDICEPDNSPGRESTEAKYAGVL